MFETKFMDVSTDL